MRESTVEWIKSKPVLLDAIELARFVKAKRDYRFRLSSPPGHFYSAIPSKADIERAHAGTVPRALAGIDLREEAQFDLLASMAAYNGELPFDDEPRPGLRYRFDNEMFARGDGVILYGMLRHFRPPRIVEVGSGFSSALMLDANDRWFDRQMDLTFIEPYPARLNSLLQTSDHASVTIIERPVQDVDPSVFKSLIAGDFLFIDSSHVCKVGSDVHHLVFDVLPTLAPGVIVHFHDIIWPFEYPRQWAEAGRSWNEVHLLRAYLTDNPNFEVLLFNNWLGAIHAKRVSEVLPEWSHATTGSLWFRCLDA